MKDYVRLEEEIESIESEYLAACRQFTALDIGNELKEKGINARQREISPIVRRHFEDSGLYQDALYTRSLIDVKEGDDKAFLYFAISADPTDYRNTDQNPVPYDPSKPTFPGDLDNIAESLCASKRSKVMHNPGCTYAKRIKQENLLKFESDDSIASQYRKCMRE